MSAIGTPSTTNDRALPFGASCAGSCQRVAVCRADHGIKGSEGECIHTPSQFIRNPLAGGNMSYEGAGEKPALLQEIDP